MARNCLRLRVLGVLAFVLGLNHAAALDGGAPWNLQELKKAPVYSWSARTNVVFDAYKDLRRYDHEPPGTITSVVEQVVFESLVVDGKPSKVRSWLAKPNEERPPFPTVLLIGESDPRWAGWWARHGFAALMIDTFLDGEDRSRAVVAAYKDFPSPVIGTNAAVSSSNLHDLWPYREVAAVIQGHSFLASLPDVDPGKIGVIGFGWGGYLVRAVAGIDDRLKVAVSAYDCRAISCEERLPRVMNAASRALFEHQLDPALFAANVNCPVLFMPGYLQSEKSFSRVPAQLRYVRYPGFCGPHWTGEVDDASIDFVERVLKADKPLPRLTPAQVEGETAFAVVTPSQAVSASLRFLGGAQNGAERVWSDVKATINEAGKIVATLPKERPLRFYFAVQAESDLVRNLSVFTELVELE